jgi:hypothetical protein
VVHGKSVDNFISQALADAEWRGNGLEFDRLSSHDTHGLTRTILSDKRYGRTDSPHR